MAMTTKQVNNRVNGAARFTKLMQGEIRIEQVTERASRPEVELAMADGTVLVVVVKDIIYPAPTRRS